jgi:hypothetical protein
MVAGFGIVVKARDIAGARRHSAAFTGTWTRQRSDFFLFQDSPYGDPGSPGASRLSDEGWTLT